jgi:16S rRNA processing protein RimM
LGFSIVEDGKMIGEVIEVIEMPHQVLCKVMYKGNEALIPIHEESLEKVDKKNKLIHVNLPEGLLDMYS